MTREKFSEVVKQLTFLDGAMGTNMMKQGMPKDGCAEAWILDHADLLTDLEKAYVAAGSQIVYAPTFSANRISLEKHGLKAEDVERLNRGLVEVTRAAVGPEIYIAGDITTTGELLEPIGELEEEELLEAYREQIRVLADAGVDLIVAETLLCVREAELALQATREVCDLPFMATLAVQPENGRAIFGGSAVELIQKMQEQGADAAGINCSAGPAQLTTIVEEMTAVAKIPVIVKPNAGMPVLNAQGVAEYQMQPEEFAKEMQPLLAAGARVVGGCCGTSPAFIEALKSTVK